MWNENVPKEHGLLCESIPPERLVNEHAKQSQLKHFKQKKCSQQTIYSSAIPSDTLSSRASRDPVCSADHHDIIEVEITQITGLQELPVILKDKAAFFLFSGRLSWYYKIEQHFEKLKKHAV